MFLLSTKSPFSGEQFIANQKLSSMHFIHKTCFRHPILCWTKLGLSKSMLFSSSVRVRSTHFTFLQNLTAMHFIVSHCQNGIQEIQMDCRTTLTCEMNTIAAHFHGIMATEMFNCFLHSETYSALFSDRFKESSVVQCALTGMAWNQSAFCKWEFQLFLNSRLQFL